MSTHAVIARAQGDTWAGRSIYSDGYPTFTGHHLWQTLREHYRGDVTAFLAVMIDQHLEHRTAPGAPWHFEVDCFCHEDDAETPFDLGLSAEYLVTSFDEEVNEEWAYVFNPRTRCLYLFAADREFDPDRAMMVGDWCLVTPEGLALDGDEPDWEAITRQAEEVIARRAA